MWLTELYQGSSWGKVRASISPCYAARRSLFCYLQRECNVLETFEYGNDVTEMGCMAPWIKHGGECSRRRWTYHIKAGHLTEQVSVSVRLWTCDPRYSVWLWISSPRTEKFCVFSLYFQTDSWMLQPMMTSLFVRLSSAVSRVIRGRSVSSYWPFNDARG
jgi:hypothetical protein